MDVAHAGCCDDTFQSPMHYIMYGKSTSRGVHALRNISSTPRSSPVVFSPHWWQACLGHVCKGEAGAPPDEIHTLRV
jgi:hypothetical protein